MYLEIIHILLMKRHKGKRKISSFTHTAGREKVILQFTVQYIILHFIVFNTPIQNIALS